MPLSVEKGFEPSVWTDYRGLAWSDPYRDETQDYNLAVAERGGRGVIVSVSAYAGEPTADGRLCR